jgi:hypothetical protein
MFAKMLSFILTGLIFAFLIPALLHVFFSLGLWGFLAFAIIVCLIGMKIWG